MNLASIIANISIIVWILPIFRQYETRLKYFFIVLGLSDPINILIINYLHLKLGFIHTLAAVLLLYSLELNDYPKIPKIYKELLALTLFIAALIISNLYFLTFIIHIIILARIALFLSLNIHYNSTLLFFYAALLLYELTVVTKLGIYLSGTHSGFILSYITLAFEVFIGVFFILFKENDSRLQLRI